MSARGGSPGPGSISSERSTFRVPSTSNSTAAGSELPAATGLRDDRRDPCLRGGAARHACEPVSRILADDVRQPERNGQGLRTLLDGRRVVDRERLERFDQIAAVEIDQDVGRRDHLVEDRPRERVRVRPVVRPGKAAVEVLPVLGDDERRAPLERPHAHDGHSRDRAGKLAVSSSFINRVTAAIDEYSQPWTPAISAT